MPSQASSGSRLASPPPASTSSPSSRGFLAEVKKCRTPSLCTICQEMTKEGDWIHQGLDGEWQHYQCVLALRDLKAATIEATSDITEEDFGFECLICSVINPMEATVCSGCSQDLSTLDIDEDGEDPIAPAPAPAQPSAEAATSTLTEIPELKFQLEHAREYFGQKKVPTSWAGPEELAFIFPHDLEEMKQPQIFQEIMEKFKDYYGNRKSLEVTNTATRASASTSRPTSMSAAAPRAARASSVFEASARTRPSSTSRNLP